MILFLIINIFINIGNLGTTITECSIAFLPGESATISKNQKMI
jgi:hypothetical protein